MGDKWNSFGKKNLHLIPAWDKQISLEWDILSWFELYILPGHKKQLQIYKAAFQCHAMEEKLSKTIVLDIRTDNFHSGGTRTFIDGAYSYHFAVANTKDSINESWVVVVCYVKPLWAPWNLYVSSMRTRSACASKECIR